MLDADGVELDVHCTRDGAIVVHHDPAIPGVGPIAQLSLIALDAAAERPYGSPELGSHYQGQVAATESRYMR